jgi:glutaminase
MAGDQLWNRVGREPSGSAFNSIVQLESEKGVPRNPFINAGAIVVSDIILGRSQPREAIGQVLRLVRDLAGDDTLVIDEQVARAELATGFRNEALANFTKAFGNLDNTVDRVLGVYSHACSIAMSCRQLAMAGRYLMLGGRNPGDGTAGFERSSHAAHQCVDDDLRALRQFGRVCLSRRPAGEIGRGRGILLIAPGVASIAVWAPGLNAQGNSLLGSIALERLAARAGWSVFEARIRRRDTPAAQQKSGPPPGKGAVRPVVRPAAVAGQGMRPDQSPEGANRSCRCRRPLTRRPGPDRFRYRCGAARAGPRAKADPRAAARMCSSRRPGPAPGLVDIHEPAVERHVTARDGRGHRGCVRRCESWAITFSSAMARARSLPCR